MQYGCIILAYASNETFVSRVRKLIKIIFTTLTFDTGICLNSTLHKLFICELNNVTLTVPHKVCKAKKQLALVRILREWLKFHAEQEDVKKQKEE